MSIAGQVQVQFSQQRLEGFQLCVGGLQACIKLCLIVSVKGLYVDGVDGLGECLLLCFVARSKRGQQNTGR